MNAERNYNKIYNEGGESYNPHRQAREQREHAILRTQAKAHAETPQGKIDALYRRIELECGSVAREWGNIEEIDTLQSSLHAEINKIKAQIEVEFLKTWTLDETKTRRAGWNDFIMDNISSINRNPMLMSKREQAQGWTFADLKKAVAIHKI
jgi:hypothetical protein